MAIAGVESGEWRVESGELRVVNEAVVVMIKVRLSKFRVQLVACESGDEI